MRTPPCPRRSGQHGATTLLLCALLLLVLGLAALWASRHVAVAQRMAGNDLRSAVASAAADAGLAWTRAMLNTGRIDGACHPTFSGGQDFRDRALLADGDGHYRATTGNRVAALCSNTGVHRWECRCDGSVQSAGAGGERPEQPVFSIRFADTDTPGQLTLLSRGCSQRSTACTDPGRTEAADEGIGLAERAQHLALLSAVRRPPTTPVVQGNGAFVRVFGYPASQYRLQPALTRLSCDSNCGADLRQAFARGRRLIWIDGNLTLREPLPAPTDGEPVVLLVDGQLDVQAAMTFSGLLYARSGIRWTPPAGSRAAVRGAVVTDGQWTPTEDVLVDHDPALLQRISRRMGSYLPVPGGWSMTR